MRRRAAYDAVLASGIPADRIVLLGESLGSAVAVRLAAEKPVAAVVLEAPFPSVAAVAGDIYWVVACRLADSRSVFGRTNTLRASTRLS